MPLSLFCARVVGILLLACSLTAAASPAFAAQNQKDNPDLQRVYKLMESVGKNFRTFSAKIIQKQYIAILKEFGEAETGEFYLGRDKDGSTMIRHDIFSPGRTITTIKGDKLMIYRPKQKQVQTASLSKDMKNKTEFLSLGIGQPPSELQKTFDVSYEGEEAVGGEPCAVLVLKPKSGKTIAGYTTITMWVKKSTGIPIQNKLQEANRNYVLMTFSNEKLNSKLSDSVFEQKIPKGVEELRLR